MLGHTELLLESGCEDCEVSWWKLVVVVDGCGRQDFDGKRGG